MPSCNLKTTMTHARQMHFLWFGFNPGIGALLRLFRRLFAHDENNFNVVGCDIVQVKHRRLNLLTF
jgi:hypothetical protein